MMRSLTEILDRSSATILGDVVGAAALMVILIGGLSLPSVF